VLRTFSDASMLATAQLQSASVVLQIAMGVEYLQTNMVRHGSLWPGNVTISADGKRVKLADYGRTDRVVFAALSAQLEESTTDTDKWRGAYTAPEILAQLMGGGGRLRPKAAGGGTSRSAITTRQVNHGSSGGLRGVEPDLYALGCIMARMAQTGPLYKRGTPTGPTPPWDHRPLAAAAERAHEVLTTALTAANSTLAPMGVSMTRLAAECVAIRPSERPDIGTVLSRMRMVTRQAALDELHGEDESNKPPAPVLSDSETDEEERHEPQLRDAIKEASRLTAQELQKAVRTSERLSSVARPSEATVGRSSLRQKDTLGAPSDEVLSRAILHDTERFVDRVKHTHWEQADETLQTVVDLDTSSTPRRIRI